VKKLKPGANFVILGTSGKYYQVRYSGSKTGYVLKTAAFKLQQGKIKSKVILRKSAKASAKKVTTLKKNSSVTIIGKKGSWYSVKAGKKNGYVPKKNVKIIK
jgi:uncharacterized protein YgiM (DUF1202 family)